MTELEETLEGSLEGINALLSAGNWYNMWPPPAWKTSHEGYPTIYEAVCSTARQHLQVGNVSSCLAKSTSFGSAIGSNPAPRNHRKCLSSRSVTAFNILEDSYPWSYLLQAKQPKLFELFLIGLNYFTARTLFAALLQTCSRLLVPFKKWMPFNIHTPRPSLLCVHSNLVILASKALLLVALAAWIMLISKSTTVIWTLALQDS